MLLASLLQTLSTEEIGRIRIEGRLPERSRLIFERIATSPTSPPQTSALCAAFRISEANLYRLYSSIVDECLRVLAPNEEFGSLKFFLNKFLYRPFVTEFGRIEKQLRAARDREAQARLYEFVFEALMKFPIIDVDVELLRTVGKKWRSAAQQYSVDDAFQQDLRIALMEISKLPTRKKLTIDQMEVITRKIMAPLQQQAKTTVDPVALRRYYFTEWKASMFDRHYRSIGAEWLLKTLEVVRQNAQLFPPEQEERVETEYAFAITDTEPEIALNIFRKYYRNQTPDRQEDILFLIRFARAAIHANDTATAWEVHTILDKNQTIRSSAKIKIMVDLILVRILLLENNLTEAEQAISEARKLLADGFFLTYDLQLRMFECLLCLKRKDYAQTELLVRRNIKWLRSRRFTMSRTSWITAYNIVDAIVQYRMTGEQPRPSLLLAFNGEFKAELGEFHHMLKDELPEST